MNTSDSWRKEITELSNDDLIDELMRPTGDWKEDIQREVLKRIFVRLRKE